MDRLSRFAPLSGLTFAVLFAVGSAFWAFDQPPRDAGSEEVTSFYESSSTEILIGGTISIVSLLFLVWFGSVLHERLVAAEAPRRSGLPLVAFGGAVLTAAVGLGAESINMAGALSAEDGQLTADTSQVYFDVSYALGAPAAGVALAMIAAPTALVALQTGRLVPGWAAWLALLVALAALTPVMLTPAFAVVFGFVIALFAGSSVQLYRQN